MVEMDRGMAENRLVLEDGSLEQKELEHDAHQSPHRLNEALRGVFRDKVMVLLEKGNLTVGELDELLKIIQLIDRISHEAWDFKAAVIEVMERFGDFLRHHLGGGDELQGIARWIEAFFQEVEKE